MEAAWRMESTMELGEGSGDEFNTTWGLRCSTLGLPMAHESSNKFRLNFLSWICALTQYLSRQYLPISELRARHCQDSISWAGRAQLAENVLVAAVSFHYSQFPPYSVHCWRGSLGGLLQEMFCGCQHGPSHVPLETNLAAMCKLASSVEVCKKYLDRDKIISILPNVFFPFQFILRQSGGSIDQSNLDP